MNAQAQLFTPRGKQKRLYAKALTLREAAERLLETVDEHAQLPARIDDNELWRPAG